MNIPEAIVSRVSFNKFGQLFIQFKVKKEDQSQEMKDHFMDLWESGNSLALATAPFQVEDDQSTAIIKTGAPMTSYSQESPQRGKTVYERLRWEVVKDVADAPDVEKDGVWFQFKSKAIAKKGLNLIFTDPSSKIWTPEEAERLIAEFQGIPALEQAKNL